MNNNVNLKENSIIELIENEPRVLHRVIAEHTENNQISIRKLIEKYRTEFESFGKLSFQMTKTTVTELGNGRDSKTFFLNESQSVFLMTLLKNSEIVVNFKVDLVTEFFELREKLNEKPALSVWEKVMKNERLQYLHLDNGEKFIVVPCNQMDAYIQTQAKSLFNIEKRKLDKNTLVKFHPALQPKYEKLVELNKLFLTPIGNDIIGDFFEDFEIQLDKVLISLMDLDLDDLKSRKSAYKIAKAKELLAEIQGIQ